jgi:hypothetical protein
MKYKIRPYRAKKLIIKANENNNYYPETGYLQVKVQDLLNNEPIKDALVRISLVTLSGLYNEYAEGNLIDEYRTDESGNIPITRLQAYNELNSENKIYMIATHADGYFNAYVFNIQIFPDTTTEYTVNLSKITSEGEKFNFIIQPYTRDIKR